MDAYANTAFKPMPVIVAYGPCPDLGDLPTTSGDPLQKHSQALGAMMHDSLLAYMACGRHAPDTAFFLVSPPFRFFKEDCDYGATLKTLEDNLAAFGAPRACDEEEGTQEVSQELADLLAYMTVAARDDSRSAVGKGNIVWFSWEPQVLLKSYDHEGYGKLVNDNRKTHPGHCCHLMGFTAQAARAIMAVPVAGL